MLRVVRVRTSGRLRIKPQTRKIKLFEPDATGVIAHSGVSADELKKRLPLGVRGRCLTVVGDCFQKCDLLFQR